MKNIYFVTLIAFLLVACSSGLTPVTQTLQPTFTTIPTVTPESTPTAILPEPERISLNYEVSQEFVQNPERGFSSESDIEDTDLNEYYEDDVTLVYTTVYLDEYRESDIPPEILTQMETYFKNVRLGGVKVILRFTYNDGPYPNPEPDASLDQILRHIEQITPVLQSNADVIAWVEAGFVGAWGEWHASTNGLDKNIDAKQTILNSLLEAVPQDRSVLLRYPVDIMTIYPTPLTGEVAFSGTNQSRVGFHNDCFLASSNDENTFERDGVFTFQEELNYMGQSTQFVPVGGESCALNPPRSDCPTALQELAIFHYSELGDGWHPDVLNAWDTQGCYREIEDRMGYRLSLLESTVNEIVSPGGVLDLSVSLENSGFASPVNYRPVYLVLDGPTRFEVLLPVEARLWLPGKHSFNTKIRLPASMIEGEYRLALWMPDSYDSLKNNPRYSVNFANYNLWEEASGYNILRTISVDPAAGGNVDSSASEFMVIE